MNQEFARIQRLPPYVFNLVGELKHRARQAGEDIIDFGMGSLEFSKLLLREAKVAVSPGVGFGDYGDDHVRLSLIENEQRARQALRNIRRMMQRTPEAAAAAK